MPVPDHTAPAELDWAAGDLAIAMPAFDTATTCGAAFEWFAAHRDQVAAAIVDGNGRVTGLANRLRFLARYAQRFIPELYSREPIGKLANGRPLIVDEHVNLAELGKMLTLDWPDALRECFVVTRAGCYLGIGTSEALVKGKMRLLLARETQLNLALAEAQAANTAKTNFLALMSHELRTPLNAIIGFSEVLSAEIFGAHAVPRYRSYAADIHDAGKHLLALINDILDLSKLEAGKMELRRDCFDVAELFGECLTLVEKRAAEHFVGIDLEAPAHIPRLQADRLRVKQVLLNLLSNAIKFTPSGGKVSLRVELDANGGLCLAVCDTGIGMSAEQIPQALEPFRQIDSPLSRSAEGTGLGLSLVKALTEQHGGTLALDSAPGHGTQVRVNFPPARTVWAKQSAVA